MTDKEMLDWLEQQEGYGLISDDFGRWAVATAGMQNVPDDTSVPSDINSMFMISADEWRPSVREAILAAVQR